MTMLPGRELDARIAVKVMGWTRPKRGVTWYRADGAGCSDTAIPHYSTEIAAAWLVIDRMMDTHGGFGVWLAQTHESLALCEFQIGDVMHESEGVTFPHAICMAALAAIAAGAA